MDAYLPFVLCMVFFSLGVYAVLAKRNLIKILIGLIIAEYAVNLFLIMVAFRAGGRSPIFSRTEVILPDSMVDPLPHALVLTAIVIGLASTAFIVALAMRIHDRYGTYDITKIRELRG